MESKSSRKRRRGGAEASGDNASGDESTNKTYSIRTRRTKNTNEENDTEKGASSKATASTPTTPTTAPHDGETSNSTQSQTRSSALQVTRELHAQIMSKVRDLAPTINNTKPTNTTKLTIPSNPPTPTGSTQTTDPVSNHQANTSTPNSPSAAANKSQSVMELQNVLSQYVQRHLANAQSSTSPAPRSNPPTPRGSSTPTTSTPNPSNQPRGTIPASLIANKLMLAANSTLQHNMHNPKDPRDKSQNGTGNDASNRAPTTFASKRTAARSMLDNSVPVMSVQYKQQKHEKRQGTASYHSDEVVDDDGSNYFLNAAHHELQNMEDELAFSEKLAQMAREIEHLERAVARRDRVIDKLHAELEEKDSLMSLFPTGSLLPGL